MQRADSVPPPPKNAPRDILSAHDRDRIAVAACCSPRTVDRYLGTRKPMAGTSIARIERAMRNLDLAKWIRDR